MWYEAMPPLIIIGGLVFVYQKGSQLFSNLFYGKPFVRQTCDILDRTMIERDNRVSGWAFKQAGLENIPDD